MYLCKRLDPQNPFSLLKITYAAFLPDNFDPKKYVGVGMLSKAMADAGVVLPQYFFWDTDEFRWTFKYDDGDGHAMGSIMLAIVYAVGLTASDCNSRARILD